MTLNTKNPDGHYTRLVSDEPSPFVDAVNKKISQYWVRTGRDMDLQTAMFEVLAEKYDSLPEHLNK